VLPRRRELRDIREILENRRPEILPQHQTPKNQRVDMGGSQPVTKIRWVVGGWGKPKPHPKTKKAHFPREREVLFRIRGSNYLRPKREICGTVGVVIWFYVWSASLWRIKIGRQHDWRTETSCDNFAQQKGGKTRTCSVSRTTGRQRRCNR